jgi:hypothetical protein
MDEKEKKVIGGELITIGAHHYTLRFNTFAQQFFQKRRADSDGLKSVLDVYARLVAPGLTGADKILYQRSVQNDMGLTVELLLAALRGGGHTAITFDRACELLDAYLAQDDADFYDDLWAKLIRAFEASELMQSLKKKTDRLIADGVVKLDENGNLVPGEKTDSDAKGEADGKNEQAAEGETSSTSAETGSTTH